MQFSAFGQKFTAQSGVVQLMDDLGLAMAAEEPPLMLGGGNPGHLPEINALFRDRMQQILHKNNTFERMIGNYDPPTGDRAFLTVLAKLLKNQYGWPVSANNLALTNGSQTSFFYLFNLLAGQGTDGHLRRIMLPLTPEYIGYNDVGLGKGLFTACRPELAFFDDHLFKYHVDFNRLKVDDSIAALCVSRPTNPTGNVLTDDEITHLSALAKAHDIPLIIDGAYGTPFPDIIFTEAVPIWEEHMILCLSLSKLGLPGLRTGIVIACEAVIEAISRLNAIVSLAPNSVGAALTHELVSSGKIMHISQNIIRPYYQHKAMQAVRWCQEALAGIDYYLHRPEGAFFLWLWLPGLPVSSQILYERLKQRGVIIVPGEYFFPGLEDDWPHCHQCLRISYAQPASMIEAGIRIIADEIRAILKTAV